MMRHILKKGLWILILCLTVSLIGNSVYAEENEMKPIKLGGVSKSMLKLNEAIIDIKEG